MKKNFFILTVLAGSILLAFLLFQSGCKKDEEPPPPPDNEVKIPETTKIIPQEVFESNVVSVDTMNKVQIKFIFNDKILDNQSFEVGDVLVSAIGMGYLRKIDNVSVKDGQVILTTTQATLTEAVENGSFSISDSLTPDKIEKIEYIQEGVTIDGNNLEKSANIALPYNINTYLDADKKIHLTGEFDMDAALICEIDIYWFMLEYFHLGFEAYEKLDLTMTIDLPDFVWNPDPVPLAKITFGTIYATIGSLPVVITPIIELYAGANLNVQSEVTAGLEQYFSFATGIKYEHGSWGIYQEDSATFIPRYPELTAKVQAKAYIKGELKLLFWGVVAPYIYGEPYGRVEADLKNDSLGWGIYGGIEVGGGVKIEVLDEELANFGPKQFFEFEELIFSSNDSLANRAPRMPSNPYPPFGAFGAPLAFDLTWECTDPDLDPLKFDVYFGKTDPPPLVASKISDRSYTISGLSPETEYFWKIVAFDEQYSTAGPVWHYKTYEPCPGEPIVECSNKLYNTVLIGNQCWFTMNLNSGMMIPGGDPQTANNITEKYCYNDDAFNCDVYGGLYTWDEMMWYGTNGSQGICPNNWRIPSNDDWQELIDHLGGNQVAGGKLKEIGTSHWITPNDGATNMTGFTALPGGYYGDYDFFRLGEYANFWTSNKYDNINGWYISLSHHDQIAGSNHTPFVHGLSVRCMKDK